MIVAITYYTATLGAATFCGDTFSPDLIGVAWDFAENGGRCGDIIKVVTYDGEMRLYPAVDSGWFGRNCVIQFDGSCPRIGVDVPQHLAWFDGLSTLGAVRNLSEEQRAEEARQ